jgi:hypothetical protein
MFVKNSALDILISGHFWMLKCFIAVLIIAVFFTCAPAILFNKDISLPPAYELKAQHPFADISTLTIPENAGERSHGAKLTPRLIGSLLLHLATTLSWHPYTPATLFGLFFLFSGIQIGYQITSDRLVGLFLGITFSGLYATSACFSFNLSPKPFDGIALGLLGLTLISTKRQWLLAILSFLSCWTDERAILALSFIAFLVISSPELDKRVKFSRCLTIAGSILTYLITRVIFSYAFRWGIPDMSMVGIIDTRLQLLFSPLAAWSCFKGGWIAIIFAVWILYTQQDCTQLFLLLGSVVLAIVSCVLVLDISRASSFAFPLIPVSYSLLKGKGFNPRELRIIAGAGAAISLLAPNFEILMGNPVLQWLPPLLPIFHLLK